VGTKDQEETLSAIFAHVLEDSVRVRLGRGEAILVAILHDVADRLVLRNQPCRLGAPFRAPTLKMPTNTQDTGHAHVEAEAEWEPRWTHVGHPGLHRAGRKELRKALLDDQAGSV
jgi:hypothetical protein